MTAVHSHDVLLAPTYDFAPFQGYESAQLSDPPIVYSITRQHPRISDNERVYPSKKPKLQRPNYICSGHFRDYSIHYELKADGTFWIKEFEGCRVDENGKLVADPFSESASDAHHFETQEINEQVTGDFWVTLNNGVISEALTMPALYIPFENDVCLDQSSWEVNDLHEARELRLAQQKSIRELMESLKKEPPTLKFD